MTDARQPLRSPAAAAAALPSLRRGGQLFETERRLNAVLDNASVSIFLMDDRQHCVYMNRAAEQLTGWTLAEVLARDCPLHDIVHHTYPDGRPFPLHECAIDRAFPENNQERGEEVFVHRDGRFYPVGFTASPIRDDAAQVIGTIIEVRDISEEKAAAERQRLLIDELNHRVKNTLATVQSIAAQTFRGRAEGAARDLFEARLSALSTAHDVLVADNWESASLRGVIERVLGPLPADRLHLDGPDARLHPKVAVSLGMALHELAANALQHGALTVPEGRVVVGWALADGEDGRQRLDLDWREAGGPAVAPPARRGFGSRLVERQVPLEFGGSTEIAYAPGGVTCRMRIPLTPPGWDGQALVRGRDPAGGALR
ncbi:HWE histidine kinase domain-containing protein [uncultured Methylobacterium sp.]|uniref:sensor histidine kinase n=1 Tax=uncultured Methylobacterium sp. TaxID=157278 RepID=UPI0025972FF7|nr:HWE histidine kinase domain-containing protein [uncultured Methylobacterium sp.]